MNKAKSKLLSHNEAQPVGNIMFKMSRKMICSFRSRGPPRLGVHPGKDPQASLGVPLGLGVPQARDPPGSCIILPSSSLGC